MRTLKFDWLLKGFLPVVILALAIGLFNQFGRLLLFPFNNPWLAHYLSEWFGYARYAGYDVDTPLMPAVYGPLTTLVYLPTLLFKTPTSMLVAAGTINILLSGLPLIYLHVKTKDHQQSSPFYVYVLLLFYLIALCPTYIISRIHPDLLTLTLVLFSCLILCFHHDRNQKAAFRLSALLSIMAVWSKQTAAPILVSIPFYILIAYGKKSFLEYIKYLLAIGIVFSTAILLFFGFENVVVDMFVVPLKQGYWHGRADTITYDATGRAIAYLKGFGPFILVLWPYVLATLILTSISIAPGIKSKEPLRDLFHHNKSLLFSLTALCMCPVAVLASVKSFSDDSNFSFVFYPLMVAITIELLRYARSEANERTTLKDTVEAGVFSVVLMLSCASLASLSDVDHTYRLLKNNSHEEAYEIAKQYPDQIYFPWHPLSSALAEGRIDHTDFGIHDRETAHLPLSEKEFIKHLPANVTHMAVVTRAAVLGNAFMADRIYSKSVKKYFSSESTFLKEVNQPHWKFYKKKAPLLPSLRNAHDSI